MGRLATCCLIVLAACGWSEDHFLVAGIPSVCDAASECVGFEAEACVTHVRADDRSACDYDPRAARDCAKQLDQSECLDNGDLGTKSFVPPESCDLVWDGCGPLFTVPIDEGTSPPEATE